MNNRLRPLYLTALLLSVLCRSCAAVGVVELDHDNFEHLTQASTGQTTGKWFVKFYAPWCGHCKSLAPTWERLATTVASEHGDAGIVIAKADLSDPRNKELAQRFGIDGFPTLLFFADGKMHKYFGGRAFEPLLEYVTGGYRQASEPAALAVPPPPSPWKARLARLKNDLKGKSTTLLHLVNDMENIIEHEKNAAIVLVAMGAVLGILVGLVLGLKMQIRSTTTSNKSKKE